jgi:hypothetical protein
MLEAGTVAGMQDPEFVSMLIARFDRVQMISLDLFGLITHFSVRTCLAPLQSTSFRIG